MGDLTSSVSHQITYIRPMNNLGDVAYAMVLADGVHAYVQTMAGNVFELLGYGFNSISDSRQLVGGNIRWTVSTGQVEVFSSTIRAMDINVDGYFAGRWNTNGRTYKALRYQSSAQAIGPATSVAWGINASSDVVGVVNDTGVGFIFTDTYGYVDLDTRVTGVNADLALWYSSTSIQPVKITDHAAGNFGEISGTAYFSGNVNLAFVLTPIPARSRPLYETAGFVCAA